jgi:hypothetical protein
LANPRSNEAFVELIITVHATRSGTLLRHIVPALHAPNEALVVFSLSLALSCPDLPRSNLKPS